MKLKDLNPDPRNANKGTARGQKMIVSSIQEDGFGRSGLLDKNGQIIAGNKTAEASAEVFGVDTDVIVVETDGKKPVYVKRTDLDLADPDPNNPARRLAYRDNLASRFSFELDAEVAMADIEAGFDFEGIDISVADFGELLPNVDWQGNGQVVEDEPPIDRAAELREKWGTELGQLWRLGEHQLRCDDYTKYTNDQYDLIIADPPFDLIDLTQLCNWIDAGNKYALFMGDDEQISYVVRNTNQRVDRFFVVDLGILSPRGNDAYIGHLLVARFKGTNAEPPKNLHDGFSSMIKMKYRKALARKEGRELWHAHEKDIDFVEKMILHHSSINDTVIDPFIGSGNTMMVCDHHHRVCIGIDISPYACAVVIERMSKRGVEPQLC